MQACMHASLICYTVMTPLLWQVSWSSLWLWRFPFLAWSTPFWGRVHSDATAPAAGFLVITLALAFPFFGVINSFLGAGTTTLETYIIPALAYNWVYRRESAQIACPAPPPWYVHHPHLPSSPTLVCASPSSARPPHPGMCITLICPAPQPWYAHHPHLPSSPTLVCAAFSNMASFCTQRAQYDIHVCMQPAVICPRLWDGLSAGLLMLKYSSSVVQPHTPCQVRHPRCCIEP